MEHLKRLAEIRATIAALQNEADAITESIRMEVVASGPVEAVGLRAYLKKGRASTDHEAAAKAAQVDESIIEKYSTVRTTVAWAKVTKEAKVDTAPFTTQGEPVFVIESV